MTKKQKKMLFRILVAAVLYVAGLFCTGSYRLLLMLLAWAVTGWSVVRRAARTVVRGSVFGEHFLMTIATVGAFLLGEYPEGAAVMLFFQIGELFESCAVERSRRSIASLMELRPDTAFVCRGDAVEEVEPEDIAPGDILLVKPGERIAVDGIVLEGSGSLNTAQITGESLPLSVTQGDRVLSGCINLSGVLKIQAESTYEHSTVAKILELVENAAEKKAPTERMISRFARIYTPVVVVSALLLGVIPSLFDGNWHRWIAAALSFLVISCPCALVISVPLSYFGGMGAASRQGIILKGGAVMEQLALAEIAAFDKTGTLTKGAFQVSQIQEAGLSRIELLYYAAGAESMSRHPIAKAICDAAKEVPNQATVEQEEPGFGVIAWVDDRRVLAGSTRLLQREGITVPETHAAGTRVHVAVGGIYAGTIFIEDAPKENAAFALAQLKVLGIKKTVLLTGDHAAAAHKVAEAVELHEVHHSLLPQDKVELMESLLSQRKRGSVLYTGDGVNDAPVLTLADVGIAMGGVGSDAAVEAADVVILNDDLVKLPCAIRISRKTVRLARQNIAFALGVKLAVLLLAAFGIATMWLAVFADVGVSVLAICNAMRAMKVE